MRGVFLGKSDDDLYITWHMDGIKASRSAKRCPEHFDAKAISSVGIHTLEVKHTTLVTSQDHRLRLHPSWMVRLNRTKQSRTEPQQLQQDHLSSKAGTLEQEQ